MHFSTFYLPSRYHGSTHTNPTPCRNLLECDSSDVTQVHYYSLRSRPNCQLCMLVPARVVQGCASRCGWSHSGVTHGWMSWGVSHLFKLYRDSIVPVQSDPHSARTVRLQRAVPWSSHIMQVRVDLHCRLMRYFVNFDHDNTLARPSLLNIILQDLLYLRSPTSCF